MLDTWFSSGSGRSRRWAGRTRPRTCERFYPSSVMETGYEILFFWVARMVFFGIEMMGEPPFHTVYLHGTVRDAEGLKMSKTKGNVLDPTEITDEYGADALRFALATQGSAGVDLRLSLGTVESSRNFINKLWNATRFAMGAIQRASIEMADDGPARPTANLSIADRWILSRTGRRDRRDDPAARHAPVRRGRAAAPRVHLVGVLRLVYRGGQGPAARRAGRMSQTVAQTLAYAINRSCASCIPYAPFVTETLWQVVPNAGEALIVSDWPQGGEYRRRGGADYGHGDRAGDKDPQRPQRV